MSRWHCLVTGVVILALGSGCSRPARPRPAIALAVNSTQQPKAEPPAVAEPEPAVETLPVAPLASPITFTDTDVGIVSGQVTWTGELPRLHVHPTGRGIADAVIWLENAPARPAATVPEVQLLLKEERLRPFVQAVRRGTRLKLSCADERASFKASGAADFNVRLTQGRHQVQALNQPGLVEVRSELRPELRAYIWVFDHDRFALTNADGRFRLTDVPPGAFFINLWHPGWQATGTAGFPAIQKRLALPLGPGEGALVPWQVGP